MSPPWSDARESQKWFCCPEPLLMLTGARQGLLSGSQSGCVGGDAPAAWLLGEVRHWQELGRSP